jgi:hypothetical protein
LAVRPVLVPELPEPELGEAEEPPELLEPSFPLERVGAGREEPVLPPSFERVYPWPFTARARPCDGTWLPSRMITTGPL